MKNFRDTAVFKAGDSFSYEKNSALKGAKLYTEEMIEDIEEELEQLEENERIVEQQKTIPITGQYKAHNTLQEIETLGVLESKFSKAGFNILLVDDDHDVLSVNLENMKDEGFLSVTTANNATEAINLLRSNKYDLVLSDYRMGGNKLDGDKIYFYIRDHLPEEEQPPFIIISGYSDFESKALRNANIIILPKPCTYTKLMTIVKGIYVKFLRSEMEKIA